MAKQHSLLLPLNTLQWRISIIPDYAENESVFVIKISHSISDGVGFMCFLNDITDNPKLEGYPNMMLSITTLQRLFLTLAAPIYGQIETLKFFLRPDD